MASSIVPNYEVKLLMRPSAVLGPDNKLENAVLSAFSIPTSTKKMNFQFIETNTKNIYDEGWILRIRKMEDEDEFELKYKKRYPIDGEQFDNIQANIDAALERARNDGFNSATTYEAQVELGYQNKTLSISHDKPYSDAGYGKMDLPLEDASREMLTKNAPVEFKDWSGSNWGTEMLAVSRVYGPIFAKRSKGKWKDLKLHIEVWPIRGNTDTGIEHIVEASFKSSSLDEALEKRDQLVTFLQSKDWLLAQDFSRTSLVLQRY